MQVFSYEKDADGIVTVTMDMSGSVNTLNRQFSQAMSGTIERLENEDGLKGVIITSAKSTFFAGGNLNELAALKATDKAAFYDDITDKKMLLRRLEKLPVPVVAAINGAAVGAGYEICLACNYRLAWNQPSVQIGLPEVTLGLMPGGGGVVRLTKLLGLQAALPILMEGKRFSPEQALNAGMINDTVTSREQLIPRAKAWILENHKDCATRPWDRRGFTIPGGDINSPQISQAITVAWVTLQRKTRGLLPAPQRIVDTAVSALRVDIDTALRIETRQLVSLIGLAVTQNMIQSVFFQTKKVIGGASRPAGIPENHYKKVAVLGAGMMGQGISYVCAKAGIEVVLKDVSLAAAEKGKAYSQRLLDKQIARGQLSNEQKSQCLDLIKATDNEQDLQGCELVIEAVFENKALKMQLSGDYEKYLAQEGIWGSNTSTLPITQLAEASSNPENFIGIHFFSPVDRMPLVEIICGNKTSDTTLAKAFDFVKQINKTAIVVNDAPGFFTSRTFGSHQSEGVQLLSEGVHPVRIDTLAKAIGLPVGPLTSHDEISQRLSVEILETHKAMGLYDPKDDPTPAGTQVLIDMVKTHGRAGRHHGGGFYQYTDQGKSIWPTLIDLYHRPDLSISDQDVKDRLLFRPVIESLNCLQEGVLRSVPDGNIGSLLGIGAPAWTGGYIQFVNTYGLAAFIDRCRQLAEKYGKRFLPPPIVEKTLSAGSTFE